MVQDAEMIGAFGFYRLGCEEHFFGYAQSYAVDEMHYPRGVIGQAYLYGGDGEGRSLVAYGEVAGDYDVGGSSPHAALHHGDDGARIFLYRAQRALHGAVVSQGFVGNFRQLPDVVPRRPDLGVALRPDDDHRHFSAF